jgi:hypothetical protein
MPHRTSRNARKVLHAPEMAPSAAHQVGPTASRLRPSGASGRVRVRIPRPRPRRRRGEAWDSTVSADADARPISLKVVTVLQTVPKATARLVSAALRTAAPLVVEVAEGTPEARTASPWRVCAAGLRAAAPPEAHVEACARSGRRSAHPFALPCPSTPGNPRSKSRRTSEWSKCESKAARSWPTALLGS